MGESSSSIDVFFFNNAENIIKSNVLLRPFSNHCFVITALNFETNYSKISNSINCRNLNKKTLNLIRDELRLTDFGVAKNFENCDERWHVIKRILLSAIDKHAPIKKLRLKKRDRYPWVDNELHYHIAIRDNLHEIATASKASRIDSAEWSAFRAQRGLTQRLYRIKMTEYFRDKCCAAFSSSKIYWNF